jgi:voltage-gated sodium channel
MSQQLNVIANSTWFQRFILCTILLAGLLVGLETYPQLSHHPLLHVFDRIVLAIFILEVVVKMGAEGRQPWRYFRDPWNIFDFAIVASSLLPFDAQFITAFRLLRLLRVLKLVRSLPQLQLLVGALLKSIPSMFYISILLFLLFYLYGVTGTFLFSANDPIHFRSLQIALLTLFRVVTLEDWTDVMYIQMQGCDQYGYGGNEHLCTEPSAMPIVGAFYFVSFVLAGTMIVMNLFIGVVLKGMDEAQEEAREARMAARRLSESRTMALELDDMQKLLEQLQLQLTRARSQAQLNAELIEEVKRLRAEINGRAPVEKAG